MNNKKIAKIAVIILIVSALSLFFTKEKLLHMVHGKEAKVVVCLKKRCYLDMEVYYQI